MRGRVKEALPALVGLLLFGLSLAVLRRELQTLTWAALTADVLETPPSRLAAAIALTALNYAVLTGYDLIAFASIGRTPARLRVAAASFLAYAIANNVGFAMLSGASVRYRFYTRWGVSADELSRIVFAYVVTFWLGLLLIGGLSLALSPLPRELGPVARVAPPAGWLLVLASVAYVAAAVWRRRPIRMLGLELTLPQPRFAIGQLVISILDWAAAGAVLFVLLPAGSIPFLAFMGAFLASQLLGLASHVPGGVGVFEGLMVLLLKPFLPSTDLLPVLIAYRARERTVRRFVEFTSGWPWEWTPEQVESWIAQGAGRIRRCVPTRARWRRSWTTCATGVTGG